MELEAAAQWIRDQDAALQEIWQNTYGAWADYIQGKVDGHNARIEALLASIDAVMEWYNEDFNAIEACIGAAQAEIADYNAQLAQNRQQIANLIYQQALQGSIDPESITQMAESWLLADFEQLEIPWSQYRYELAIPDELTLSIEPPAFSWSFRLKGGAYL